MKADSGAGMKFVGLAILVSITLFVVGVIAVWVGDVKFHPAADSHSVPTARVN